MSDDKKPAIRFKNYSDDWEQRKLGELGSLKNGMNFSKEAMGIGFPFVNLQNIFGNNVIDVTNLGKAMASDSQLKDYNLLNGDVLFVRSSVKLEGVGEAALVPQNLENTTYSGFIIRFRDEYGLDNNFKRFIFGIESVRNQIMAQATNSANKNISQTVLENLCLKIPNKSEQEKIGLYFSNLDKLITLHHRKYDKLQNLKKAMLEKMFPKNGSNVPEIRFKGFTDDWEQRKFSEGVSEIGDGLHGTPIYCEDGNVYFINGNNLVDGKIVISAETKKVNESQQSIADKSLDDTTILMSINGTIGNLAYYSGERLMLGKSAAYIKVSEFDKRFVYAYLQAPSVQGYFMDSLTGTTIKNLGLKAIREMIMFIPQDVDEQKRIGKFFDYLDHLITLHQRELEKLKNVKKAMLEKMFV